MNQDNTSHDHAREMTMIGGVAYETVEPIPVELVKAFEQRIMNVCKDRDDVLTSFWSVAQENERLRDELFCLRKRVKMVLPEKVAITVIDGDA